MYLQDGSPETLIVKITSKGFSLVRNIFTSMIKDNPESFHAPFVNGDKLLILHREPET